MEKSYKFRLYPNQEQEILIQKTFGCCRYVYNHYLNKRVELYQLDKGTLNYAACSADLTQLKKELEWLREVDSIPLQESLRNLDLAYQNFFRRVKQSKKPGFPRYKSKRDKRRSYKTKQHVRNGKSTIWIEQKHIRLPKLGLVKCRVSKQVEGRILSATITQNPSGNYFVSLCCTEVEIPQVNFTGEAIGLDMGLKDFAVASTGERYPNHKYLAKSEKKLKRLQRRLSRKPKGSRNREKARIQVARLHEKIADRRMDTLHKLSTELVNKYDAICLEGLQVRNMVKNHSLAKSITDASWSEFARMLKYKCGWQHKALVQVDPFYPSSQICSTCGAKWPGTKDLAVREWECPDCGAFHDRDINAAKNILNEGLRLLA